MKINVAKCFKDLDGTDIMDAKTGDPVMMNRTLGNILTNRKMDDPIAAVTLGTKLYRSEGEVEVTTEEISMINEVMKVANLPALSAGQILMELNGSGA